MNCTLAKVSSLFLIFITLIFSAPFTFELIIIDDNYNGNHKPGWSRIGDIDGDGHCDVVAGGGNTLNWYKAPDWTRYAVGSAGANGGILFDVDGDDDLDIISSVYSQNNKLYWFENPSDPTQANWKTNCIDNSSGLTFQHDLEIGDIDMDGVKDDFVVLHDDYSTGKGIVKWYHIPDNSNTSWGITTVTSETVGGVGLAIGDINKDGRNDIVRGGKWYEAPDPPTGSWIEHTITTDHITNVRVIDMDGDRELDIVVADGWNSPGKVQWFENKNAGSSWILHEIASLGNPENMVVLDLDRDGDYEVITGEMKGETNSTFLVFEYNGNAWVKHTIDDSHGSPARMNAADFDGDGDMDIVCDGNGQDHIYLWKNTMDTPIINGRITAGNSTQPLIQIIRSADFRTLKLVVVVPAKYEQTTLSVTDLKGHLLFNKLFYPKMIPEEIILSNESTVGQLFHSGCYVVSISSRNASYSKKFSLIR